MAFPTLALPTSQSFLANPETVSILTAPGDAVIGGVSAVRYEMSLREVAASNGIYQGGYCVWTFSDTITVTDPTPGGYLVDADGNRHTFLNTTHSDVLDFWKCETVNLKLAAGLTDTVNVQHQTISQDSAAGRSSSWANVSGQTGIAARVQPETVENFNERGVRSTMTVYKVYLASGISATDSSGNWARLNWINGSTTTTLDITGYTQSERIDVLPLAECRKDP